MIHKSKSTIYSYTKWSFSIIFQQFYLLTDVLFGLFIQPYFAGQNLFTAQIGKK